MSKIGRPRQPRFVLSTEFDGKRVFVTRVAEGKGSRGTPAYIVCHAPDIGMAMFFTKYKADKMRLELSGDTRQYEVEPLHLNEV